MLSIPLRFWFLYIPYLCSIFFLLSITFQRKAIILGQYVDFALPSIEFRSSIGTRFAFNLAFDAHLQVNGKEACMGGLAEAINYEWDMVGFTRE